MAKVRNLNSKEQHELLYALSLARSRNDKKAAECIAEANKSENEYAHADYEGEANRYEAWAELDSDLIDAIQLGNLVILIEDREG